MTMPSGLMVALPALAVVAVTMVVEAEISKRHERMLRARGAFEPVRDVYRLMQLAYPLSFVAMAVEGAMSRVPHLPLWVFGAALFLVAKLLKYWAIASLGDRWTFRVLVPVGETLVSDGPYRWMTHPNYIAVIGELLGMAFMMRSVVAGPVAILGFGMLITRRIAVENRALGRL